MRRLRVQSPLERVQGAFAYLDEIASGRNELRVCPVKGLRARPHDFTRSMLDAALRALHSLEKTVADLTEILGCVRRRFACKVGDVVAQVNVARVSDR